MKEKDLNRFYYLKKEIKDLEERIATLDAGVSAIKYDSVSVNGSHKVDSLQEKIVELKDLWIEKRVAALEEYIKIERYILNIPDEELRLIFRYRYMDLMKWEQIGDKIGYDRTSVAKKVRGWFKKHANN